MTDLTEQWKRGKLPSGMYYIEFKDGDIAKDVYAFGSWGNINEHFLEQVLAPVPSFEKWQAKLEENAQLKEEVENCEFILKSRESEIVKFKGLLRECLAHLTIGKYGTSVTPINILCDEVEEVLK